MTQSVYIPLGGGIDLVTPPAQLAPGKALSAVNYDCPVTGGYRRIEGYTQIGPEVPGEGPLLGVVSFGDADYAIRKDVSTDTATFYKLNTSTNEWDEVGAVHNGRHEFTEGNVYGTESGRALYGVGGRKPFELTLSGTFTELADAPSGAVYIELFKNHLFLGFTEGSLQHSTTGDPADWDAATGSAGEIGVGQTLTGLVLGRGGVLHVLCRDSIQTLYGSSSADWRLEVTVPNSGARPYSGQSLMQPYFIAERGIGSLEATNAYGDFRPMQPGYQVEPIFLADNLFTRVKASAISKQRAQYRVWFDNGTGVYMSPTGITTVRFPAQVEVAYSGERDTGAEVLLFGDDEGNVYRLDNNATSFNGEPIEAFLTLAYNAIKSPSIRKRFRRVFWDVRSGSNANISILTDFDYGRVETATPRREFIQFLLGGGLWDVANWNQFSWSSPSLGQEPMNVSGTGTAINFAIYSKSDSEPHEILGYDIHFEQRRPRRG